MSEIDRKKTNNDKSPRAVFMPLCLVPNVIETNYIEYYRSRVCNAVGVQTVAVVPLSKRYAKRAGSSVAYFK